MKKKCEKVDNNQNFKKTDSSTLKNQKISLIKEIKNKIDNSEVLLNLEATKKLKLNKKIQFKINIIKKG